MIPSTFYQLHYQDFNSFSHLKMKIAVNFSLFYLKQITDRLLKIHREVSQIYCLNLKSDHRGVGDDIIDNWWQQGWSPRGRSPLVNPVVTSTQCVCVTRPRVGQPHNSGKIVYQDHDNGSLQDSGQAFAINCILLGAVIVQSAASCCHCPILCWFGFPGGWETVTDERTWNNDEGELSIIT